MDNFHGRKNRLHTYLDQTNNKLSILEKRRTSRIHEKGLLHSSNSIHYSSNLLLIRNDMDHNHIIGICDIRNYCLFKNIVQSKKTTKYTRSLKKAIRN